jgi:4-diphosphocytidyl-2-C-methyl-D-erythritol kinase
VIVYPNCKINLGLFVTEKRSDGFHNIESIFVPVPLQDVLEVSALPDSSLQFTSSGIHIAGNEESNICIKAYRLLQKDFNIPGIKAHLIKNIPTGAGLGGGSADGAYMLMALNQIFNLQLNTLQLKKYAASLGSDCPFFIKNKTMLVSGRGEIMQPIDVPLAGCNIVVVHPAIHMSTPEAYGLITPQKAVFNLAETVQLSKDKWKHNIINAFEMPIANLHPEILEIKSKLYLAGAVYASMSGSGSAVYGIFDREVQGLQSWFSHYFYWQGTL